MFPKLTHKDFFRLSCWPYGFRLAGHKFAWEYQDLGQGSALDPIHSMTRISSVDDAVWFSRNARRDKFVLESLESIH